MKKSVRYILGGILAVLGFSSCSALREARAERAERMQEATKAAVLDHLDKTLGNEQRTLEAERRQHVLDSIRRAEEQRNVLLYAVPNVPFQQQVKER